MYFEPFGSLIKLENKSNLFCPPVFFYWPGYEKNSRCTGGGGGGKNYVPINLRVETE